MTEFTLTSHIQYTHVLAFWTEIRSPAVDPDTVARDDEDQEGKRKDNNQRPEFPNLAVRGFHVYIFLT
jgi:hypothetical protein